MLTALMLALLLSPLAANICFADHHCSGGGCLICKFLADQLGRSLAFACALPALCVAGLFAPILRALPPVARRRDMRAASPVHCKVRMND